MRYAAWRGPGARLIQLFTRIKSGRPTPSQRFHTYEGIRVRTFSNYLFIFMIRVGFSSTDSTKFSSLLTSQMSFSALAFPFQFRFGNTSPLLKPFFSSRRHFKRLVGVPAAPLAPRLQYAPHPLLAPISRPPGPLSAPVDFLCRTRACSFLIVLRSTDEVLIWSQISLFAWNSFSHRLLS